MWSGWIACRQVIEPCEETDARQSAETDWSSDDRLTIYNALADAKTPSAPASNNRPATMAATED